MRPSIEQASYWLATRREHLAEPRPLEDLQQPLDLRDVATRLAELVEAQAGDYLRQYRRSHGVEVADALIEEIMTSARRKGCAIVEVMLPENAALRACWTRQGFNPESANIYRAGVPVRAPATH